MASLESAVTTNAADVEAQIQLLEKTANSGANWFYWIAALSLINSVISMSGSQTNFIVGLGITQVVDGFAHAAGEHAPDMATALKVVGFVIGAAISGAFALIGWLARKRALWAFVVGMAFYGFDSLVFLAFGIWMSLGFHAFALIGIAGGFNATRKLLDLQMQLVPAPPPVATGIFEATEQKVSPGDLLFCETVAETPPSRGT